MGLIGDTRRRLALSTTFGYRTTRYWNARWAAGYAENDDQTWKWDTEALDQQIALFRSLNIESVFDYGGGDGHSLRAHIDAGYLKAYGYGEVSDTAIRLARDILPTDCPIYDLKSEPIQGRFDLAYTRAVLVTVRPDEVDEFYTRISSVARSYVFMQEAFYYPEPKGHNFNHTPWEYFDRNGFDVVWMRYQLLRKSDGSLRHPGQGYELLMRRSR